MLTIFLLPMCTGLSYYFYLPTDPEARCLFHFLTICLLSDTSTTINKYLLLSLTLTIRHQPFSYLNCSLLLTRFLPHLFHFPILILFYKPFVSAHFFVCVLSPRGHLSLWTLPKFMAISMFSPSTLWCHVLFYLSLLILVYVCVCV